MKYIRLKLGNQLQSSIISVPHNCKEWYIPYLSPYTMKEIGLGADIPELARVPSLKFVFDGQYDLIDNLKVEVFELEL